MHHTAILFLEVGAVLLGLGVLGALALRVGISPIPLYLIAGLAFGTGGMLPLATSEEFISVGAEIGVILLLLTLGLEYNADELVTSLKGNARAGLVDLVLNAAPGAIAALLLGWGPVAAVAMAGRHLRHLLRHHRQGAVRPGLDRQPRDPGGAVAAGLRGPDDGGLPADPDRRCWPG